MKKIVLLIGMMFAIVGCGTNCGDKPKDHRAYYFKNGGNGMAHHIGIYTVLSNVSHSPSLKCPKYSYVGQHIYTDKLGTVHGDEVIMKSSEGYDFVLDKNVVFYLTPKTIKIRGIQDPPEINTDYIVDTQEPNSWGVPIEGR